MRSVQSEIPYSSASSMQTARRARRKWRACVWVPDLPRGHDRPCVPPAQHSGKRLLGYEAWMSPMSPPQVWWERCAVFATRISFGGNATPASPTCGQQERAYRIAQQMAPGPVDGHRRLERSSTSAIHPHLRPAGWATGFGRTDFNVASRPDLHTRASKRCWQAGARATTDGRDRQPHLHAWGVGDDASSNPGIARSCCRLHLGEPGAGDADRPSERTCSHRRSHGSTCPGPGGHTSMPVFG